MSRGRVNLSDDVLRDIVRAYTRTSEPTALIAARWGLHKRSIPKIVRRLGFSPRSRGVYERAPRRFE